MVMTITTLAEIKMGERAIVQELLTKGEMRRRLLDIGLVKNAPVCCLGKSPCGDPRAYLICGAVVAVRQADAGGVLVRVDA